MKRAYIYLLLISVLSSCTIYESAQYDNIIRPGAAASYDTAHRADVFVFDYHDTLVSRTVVKSPEKMDSVNVIDGIPVGDYQVVSFINCAQYVFDTMAIKGSKLSDLECEIETLIDDKGRPIGSVDSIRYGRQTISADWGIRPVSPIELKDLFYNVDIELNVSGNYHFWEAASDFSLEFRRVPSRFDGLGQPQNPSKKFTVNEFNRNAPDKVAARLRLPRFSDSDKVELHVVVNRYSMGSVVILPSKFGISPLSPNATKLTIELRMDLVGITVGVNSWVAGVIQNTTVGV